MPGPPNFDQILKDLERTTLLEFFDAKSGPPQSTTFWKQTEKSNNYISRQAEET